MKFIFCIFMLLSVNVFADDISDLTAQSWIVADETGNIIQEYNANDVRSIASITKLVTAMIVLDADQPLKEIIATKAYNKKVTRHELLYLAIVKSDNLAADLLCKNYTGGYAECIAALNAKANVLDMHHTTFADPTGLNKDNVSTATDLLKLVVAASKYPLIVEASNKNQVTLVYKNKSASFKNTNPLVGKNYNFIVSKTGFIRKSGGCIVMMLDTIHGVRSVILLGSKNTHTRIPEAALISSRF
jgi:D-alanyl-D-alanine endopeptidase (penicillin-binding protein 7)